MKTKGDRPTDPSQQLPCIYCTKTKGPFTSEAHIFPEGLVENDLSLPPGVVCDPCNHYFGAELDAAIVAFPYFSLAVQLLGLPGKAGKARKQLANVSRDDAGIWVTVPIAEPQRISTPDGGTGYRVRPLVDKTFRMPRFSRGLYHIALNLLAAELGQQFVLGEHLDRTRAYVRAPLKGAFMPFVVMAGGLDTIRPVVQGRRVTDAPGETVLVRIFNFDFYIDLLNRGGLVAWAQDSLPEPFHFIDANWKPRPEGKPGPKRYRIRIDSTGTK